MNFTGLGMGDGYIRQRSIPKKELFPPSLVTPKDPNASASTTDSTATNSHGKEIFEPVRGRLSAEEPPVENHPFTLNK